ncbi:MAG: DUF5312 domain-containing protein [Spirochaetaceae bacterium]|jgi:hypothetical protein|nr:DUF5312 domain-containing protein [Spirochaetaceae bacterium]
MDEIAHFNRLVAELSLEERARLLEKLSSQSTLSDTVLYEESKDEQDFDLESRYKQLPWYYKIWYKFLSFFNSRSPVKLFEDHLMIRIYRDLEGAAPGLYNYQKDMLLSKFQEELAKLRDGSRFFYTALDESLNRDKGGLMVFLGSLEMPDIHKLIQGDTDPAVLAGHYRDLSELELRQKALKALDDALIGITEEQRNTMYHNARILYCFKQLSSFLFDRVINSFIFDTSLQGNVCPAASVREQLLTLNNILAALRTPPPMTLLESLFIFVLMENSSEPGFDIQLEMRKLLARAEVSLQAIREFNTEIPLTKLLRCMSRNMSIVPRNIGGGEDWYAVYRERWKNIVEEQFLVFTKTRRQNDLQNSFRYFFMGNHLKMLENMGSETNPSGIQVRGNFSLSFLQTFYSVVFMTEINRFIRPILIDGEFYKKENRTEFTESYNTLIKLEDVILHYDRDISPAGEYGRRYAQAKNDMSSLPIKRRKIQIVVEEAAEDAEKIIKEAREAMGRMINVLGGILKKSPDEKYDSLANLQALSGRGTVFVDGVSKSISQFRKALQLMDEIDAMEAGK